MSKVEFELSLAGLNELMKGAEMQSCLDAAGNAVAANAGVGFEKRTHVASWVAITNVFPTTAAAAKKNYEQNALVKALGSVGLRM